MRALFPGANPNLASPYIGGTALHTAAENGDTEIIEALISAGALIEARDSYAGWTPLICASRHGRTEAVRMLLAHKADVSARDAFFGRTPLLHAAALGYIENVKLLIDAGANAGERDSMGQSAFELAPDAARSALSLVLSLGNKEERRLKNAALFMAVFRGQTDVARELIAGGADIDGPNRERGASPLEIAAGRGDTVFVSALLALGANPDFHDDGNYTALMMAAEYDHGAVVSLLLERSVEVNARNMSGSTALFLASAKGFDSIVSALVAAHADVNLATSERGFENWTPLMTAAARGHDAVVRILLSAGADLRSKNANSWTAYKLARVNGRTVSAELLKRAGAVD